jgi:chemotaxis protein CheX
MLRHERLLLSRILLDASQQLMMAEGRSWEVLDDVVGPPGLSGTLASSIGFGSTDGLRGKLVIIAQPDFFRSVYPSDLGQGGVTPDALADWAAELANQLVGRIKNLLGPHGVNFALSIPTVIGGDRINLLGRDRPSCVEQVVRVGGHRVDLLLEIDRAGHESILSGDGAAMAAAPEGSALLF